MTLASTILVPELQYWFHQFVLESNLNRSETPSPTTLESVYLPQKSFIELLFNENYRYHDYKYKYKSDTNKYGWPYVVRNRLMVYPVSAKYYVIDEFNDTTSVNFFNLQAHDFVMLNALAFYRTDSTSLTIITNTSQVKFDDSTGVLYANINTLNTNLSKLIFLYLDLKIYHRYSNYDTITLIASTLLESLFEAYVLENMYNYISTTDSYS